MTSRTALGLVFRSFLVFVGVAPFLPGLFARVPGLDALGRGLDGWFSFQCYRDEARTLAASAVCTRCLGIYVGLGLGALLARPRLTPGRQAVWLGLAVLLLFADVLSEALGLRPSSAPLRFATGALLAYPTGVAIMRAFMRVREGSATLTRGIAGTRTGAGGSR